MSKKKEDKITVQENLLGEKQREAVVSAAEKLCDLMENNCKNSCGESILGEIWPGLKNFTWDMEPELELQSLDRVGGEPGKSGVNVLAGRFSATAKDRRGQVPSRQMIIKVSPDPDKDEELACNKREELVCEWKAIAGVLKNKFEDRKLFARPLWLYDGPDKNKPAVLWAPFESPSNHYTLTTIGGRWLFVDVLEMVKYLGASWACTDFQKNKCTRKYKLKKIISAVDSLLDAHRANDGNHRHSVNFIEHYEWELRGFFDPKKDWSEKWHALWGKSENVSDFGQQWPNPVKVCEKIQKMGEHSLRMGYVHGDLHPRNIVFANDGNVRIIDFGWARPRPGMEEGQHIVKDFVLLEANLRFMTLPPFLSYESVMKLADWIGIDDPLSKDVSDEITLREELIYDLRKRAIVHIGTDNNWDVEYIVPLFLVSFGLLKHCHSADCTWAARYNVLTLARYLVENNVV